MQRSFRVSPPAWCQMQRFFLSLIAVLLIGSGVPASAGEPDPASSVACSLPEDLITPDIALPRVAAAMAAGRVVEVLAVGSGSTVGDATGNVGPAFVYRHPTTSFPYRMIEALQAFRPEARFDLTVRGGRDMTAEVMEDVVQKELAGHHYDLLVWQTGTVEAVRGLRPDTLREALEDGIEAAAAEGADVVVVDPQFSRFLRANTDVGPYETTLRQTASINGAALFHRFDLTEGWSDSGEIDLEHVKPSAREQTITALNICLGRGLAKFVLSGAADGAR